MLICKINGKEGVLRKKSALRNFAKFIGKHLCQSQKETLAQVFSCEFCEISKKILFTEHLWMTASEPTLICRIFTKQ